MSNSQLKERLERLEHLRLIAIIRQDDLSFARETAQALGEAGVIVQEFTLTNPESLDVIKCLSQDKAFHHLFIGAGSVRSLTEARSAIEAGAQFLVTPITQPEVIDYAVKVGIPIFPGAFTPSEINSAWQAGATAVKVFPATTLGPGYIKDVLAPMPYLKLVPTGGVNLENITSFLSNGAFAVGIGSHILDKTALAKKDWQALSNHARAFVKAAQKPQTP
jgi:2-dehydro-3-deoxyphosphogluconate aldolase/(4S)-4-hydroxy-2-oxoglutarate aldolase